MNRDDLRGRTKKFALRVIRLSTALPRTRVADVIGRQSVRSGTAIGANYREALRASTKKHFTAIVAIALREADETLYWLELLAESETIKSALIRDLADECQQLVSILSATFKTAKLKSE